MTLSPQDQARIIDQESAWLDSEFGGIDLSAFPDLNSPPPEDRHDDRFAKHWTDTPFSASAAALRQFVNDPDRAALEQVAAETGHETFIDEVRDRKGEIVAQQFKAARPAYIPCDENLHSLVVTAAFNWLPPSERDDDDDTLTNRLIDAGVWDVPHLVACFDALNAEGLMVLAAGTPRSLSQSERLRVSRLAQAGKISDAIGFYLEAALPDEEPTLELINDPAYRQVCDTAAWEVWQDITNDYTPTPSREAFIRRHCGQRPITIPLLNAAWAELKKREASYARSEILGQISQPKQPQPVSTKQLDELDDSAVDRLYHESLQEYARTVGRGSGVIV